MPRISKSVLNKLPRDEGRDVRSTIPESAEDYADEGMKEEESGDRWLGSDLSKALRFYQRAYANYVKATQISPETNLDCYYNAARLLFNVYQNYSKTRAVIRGDLVNVNDALIGEEHAVLQDLPYIISVHEKTIGIALRISGNVPKDLLFNTALVYTEALEDEEMNLESDFSVALELGSKALDMIAKLLSTQTNELVQFTAELDALKNYSSGELGLFAKVNNEGTSRTEELTSEEAVQPPEIFETVLEGFNAIQSILENVSDPSTPLRQAHDLINPYLTEFKQVAENLTSNFSELNSNRNEMVLPISKDMLGDALIRECCVTVLSANELENATFIWNGSDLPSTPEKYMVAADSLQTLLDRNDINVETEGQDKGIGELYWKTLTQMSEYYRTAQGLLTERKSELFKANESCGLVIAQIGEVIIARADVDLQRAQISSVEISGNTREVLLKNVNTLLRNALQVTNTTGGLRERVTERLEREKKKSGAALRLCILEKKITLSELDRIIGRKKWLEELPELVKLRFFKRFGIEDIPMPY